MRDEGLHVKHTSFNSKSWIKDERLEMNACLPSSLSKERAGGEAKSKEK